MFVTVGCVIGFVQKVLSDSQGRENYYKLVEGKVKSITVNSKGRRVKSEHFYTLAAEEIELNTKWMLERDGLILIREPFILTDELRQRVEKWIERENAKEAR